MAILKDYTLKSVRMARQENWHYSLPIVFIRLRMILNSTDYSLFTSVTGSCVLPTRPLIFPEQNRPVSHVSLQKFVSEMEKLNFSKVAAGDCFLCLFFILTKN